MPVIVVGADAGSGIEIVDGLRTPGRDLRAFVSDPEIGARLKTSGVKVALGDVSDDSHVEAAAIGCYTAVLMAEAAFDDRERSFADSRQEVLEGWARAMETSQVSRLIWISTDEPPGSSIDSALLDPGDPDVVSKAIALDEAQAI
jgi:nucleoside-diphosphate-sugar epimerase